MKDWSKERWRRLYLRESAEQRGLWCVTTRGLRDYLIRIAEDDGQIVSSGGISAAIEAIGTKDRERELIEISFELLLVDGFIRLDEAGGVFVVRLPEAQSNEPITARPRVSTTPGIGPTLIEKPRSGRWANTTPEQRSEAARLAALARHGRKGDAAGDAESTQPVTQGDAENDAAGDAAGDAGSPRAVSGQNQASGGLEESQREKTEERDQTHARTQGDAQGDASEVTHHVSASHEGISLQAAAALWLTNPQEAQCAAPSPHLWPVVLAVAAHLDHVFPPPGRDRRTKKALYGWQDTRVQVVVARLAEGLALQDLCEAISGAALDGHVKRNAQFQSISNILKSAEQVERFQRLLAAGGEHPRPSALPGGRAPSPKQPNAGAWTPPVEGR
jgi:hypothetical protein